MSPEMVLALLSIIQENRNKPDRIVVKPLGCNGRESKNIKKKIIMILTDLDPEQMPPGMMLAFLDIIQECRQNQRVGILIERI